MWYCRGFGHARKLDHPLHLSAGRFVVPIVNEFIN
jgi:hypothetical protein